MDSDVEKIPSESIHYEWQTHAETKTPAYTGKLAEDKNGTQSEIVDIRCKREKTGKSKERPKVFTFTQKVAAPEKRTNTQKELKIDEKVEKSKRSVVWMEDANIRTQLLKNGEFKTYRFKSERQKEVVGMYPRSSMCGPIMVSLLEQYHTGYLAGQLNIVHSTRFQQFEQLETHHQVEPLQTRHQVALHHSGGLWTDHEEEYQNYGENSELTTCDPPVFMKHIGINDVFSGNISMSRFYPFTDSEVGTGHNQVWAHDDGNVQKKGIKNLSDNQKYDSSKCVKTKADYFNRKVKNKHVCTNMTNEEDDWGIKAKSELQGSYGDSQTGSYGDSHTGSYGDSQTGSNGDSQTHSEFTTVKVQSALKKGKVGVLTTVDVQSADLHLGKGR